MVHSRLNIWYASFLSVSFVVMVSGVIYRIGTFGQDVPLFRVGGRPPTMGGEFASVFVPLFVIVILFGLLRRRASFLTLTDEGIIVQNYLGFGKKEFYPFFEFEGFETERVWSKLGEFEQLIFVPSHGQVIVISAFYHKNYQELKAYLEIHVRNLGGRPYSTLADLKSIFR